ncbi:motility protein A [Fodinibius sediminis]|uniref:Chemotaxis protein MotA n=1 Tax=Fodinibius sediminis TaxID=1214077 RepID=A0A521CIN6_9BACT|nr:MotA/TolQ/ExbB proton channel family protein [Fodinibius sediminis]SMO59309.1 chemotaxis protein MotA [Fodinibius sediminis]
MDKSSTIGLLGGILLIIGAITIQGSISLFLSLSAFIIVMGGIICSSFINFSIEGVLGTFALLFRTLSSHQHDLRTDIELMNMFARKARRDGLLNLEQDVAEIENDFLKNGLQLAIDRTEKNTMITIMQDQIESSRRNLNKSVDVLLSMGGYAPAFGMIGTIIGLILMLQNMQDPQSLGQGMAVALLTTLYGTVCANLILNPLAGKLEHLGDKQIIRNQMFKSALISIVDEENPRLMENKMLNYVSPKERAEYRSYFSNRTFNKEREQQLYENWIQHQHNSWENLLTALETG